MKYFFSTRIRFSQFVSAAAAVAVAVTPVQPITAADYQDQIKQLKNEVGDLNGTVDQLQLQGNTLEEAIANLKAQIASLQVQISENENKRVDLSKQIVRAEADIETRTVALEDNLRMMYLEGEVSSLEQVASSSSISEFVDKQEYRNKIRDRVATAMEEIKVMKKELEGQRTMVDRLILDDKAMKQQVDVQKAAQAKLLVETRGKESAYQKQVENKKTQITELQAKQAAANAAAAAKSGSYYVGQASSAYPWAGEGFPCSGGDPWGMCYRQCVSYTAWKVASTGRYMPFWGGVGNANQWPGNAQAAGIPTGSEPKVGSVAVMNNPPYGHTMYVEEVLNGGSQIRVSEYNFQWDGTYSERIQSSAGLTYIYF